MSVFAVYVNATTYRNLYEANVQQDAGKITFYIESCHVSEGIISADGWIALKDGEKISRVYLQNANNGYLFIMRSSIADDVAHAIKPKWFCGKIHFFSRRNGLRRRHQRHRIGRIRQIL